MATIEERIEKALLTRVASFTSTPTLSVAWPNRKFDATVSEPYLRVDHFPNRNTRFSIKGSEPHSRQGILQLTVVTPLNAGPSTATRFAGEVAAHFSADLTMTEDGIMVRVQAAPDVLPAVKQDASWDVPCSIRYEAIA